MRRFEISSFPTLIVESNSLETVRARGVVAIENALRAIVKVRKV
jgi:protein-disulfide isomerase-like protein with CxxC motif